MLGVIYFELRWQSQRLASIVLQLGQTRAHPNETQDETTCSRSSPGRALKGIENITLKAVFLLHS